jgi:hypothetical protein
MKANMAAKAKVEPTRSAIPRRSPKGRGKAAVISPGGEGARTPAAQIPEFHAAPEDME